MKKETFVTLRGLSSLLVSFGMLTAGLIYSPPALAQGAPPTPLLIKPADNAVMDNGCKDRSNGVSWNFEWSSVGSVSTYQIKVWRNSAQPVINDSNVHGTTFHYDSPHTFITNSNLTGWHWMVRAKIGRNWALWSRQGDFTVQKVNTDCH